MAPGNPQFHSCVIGSQMRPIGWALLEPPLITGPREGRSICVGHKLNLGSIRYPILLIIGPLVQPFSLLSVLLLTCISLLTAVHHLLLHFPYTCSAEQGLTLLSLIQFSNVFSFFLYMDCLAIFGNMMAIHVKTLFTNMCLCVCEADESMLYFNDSSFLSQSQSAYERPCGEYHKILEYAVYFIVDGCGKVGRKSC